MDAPLRHFLFDFGDTLAREPFCVRPPPGVPDWERRVLEVYAEPGLSDRWHLDDADFDEVAARVGKRCRLHPEAARAAMLRDWKRLRLNRKALAFAREQGAAGRAAIVTVNPRIFSEIIAPHYGLDRDFRVIVTSWQERTLDKAALCAVALERLGAPGAFATALLVDNREDNCAAFRARGGQAHRFTGDAAFARDLPVLRARIG
jgi:FMN phosphatase YigB (HAD superfamily)